MMGNTETRRSLTIGMNLDLEVSPTWAKTNNKYYIHVVHIKNKIDRDFLLLQAVLQRIILY